MRPLPNSYADLPSQMYITEGPTPVHDPQGFALNQVLADDLQLDLGDNWAAALSGNDLPGAMRPVTQAYAGHQFGHWNPQLGDGRAVLLGESDLNGVPHDIQLKGSGRTYWSRGGDGRAWLGPVLREYVISEAMHALGVPTTRALAAVTTGEPVVREQGPLPGAVLTRVATSHVRVGTFQYFAARHDIEALTALRDYVIGRHYPDVSTNAELLNAVCDRQAQLIAAWMGLGFIHGVMNTDNCHIGGVTIDYGPCAFIDDFHPQRVFSSIDHAGRYAFANQPQIAGWNLAQFATSLLPLETDRDAAIATYTEIVQGFGEQFDTEYQATFAGKLGLDPNAATTRPIIDELLSLMTKHSLDFTNTFRDLSQNIHPDTLTKMGPDWILKWQENRSDMHQKSCPAIIPRNHQIETMIQNAVAGDREKFDILMTALADPYSEPSDPELTLPPTESQVVARTFCGT